MNVATRPRRRQDTCQRNASRKSAGFRVEEVIVTNGALTILPKDRSKIPLHDIHRLRLNRRRQSRDDAALTNAKPPGEIQSTGTFGPWVADEPGDSPIDGAYRFDDADLGVFNGIAGILTRRANSRAVSRRSMSEVRRRSRISG